MASSTEEFYCATCGDLFPTPHHGTCRSCDAPGLLCEGCFGKHNRAPPLPKFREHDFVKSDHLQDRDALLRYFELAPSPEACTSHRKPLFSFCASHGGTELLCLDCAGAHAGHPLLAGLADGATSARAAFRQDGCARIAAASDASSRVLSLAATDLESLDAQWEAAREQLTTARDALIAGVIERFRLLCEEAEKMRALKATTLNERMQTADALRDKADTARPNLDRAAAVFSDADAVVHRSALLSRARSIEAEAAALAGSPPPPAHLTIAGKPEHSGRRPLSLARRRRPAVFGTDLEEAHEAIRRLGTIAGKPGASRAAGAAAAAASPPAAPPTPNSARGGGHDAPSSGGGDGSASGRATGAAPLSRPSLSPAKKAAMAMPEEVPGPSRSSLIVRDLLIPGSLLLSTRSLSRSNRATMEESGDPALCAGLAVWTEAVFLVVRLDDSRDGLCALSLSRRLPFSPPLDAGISADDMRKMTAWVDSPPRGTRVWHYEGGPLQREQARAVAYVPLAVTAPERLGKDMRAVQILPPAWVLGGVDEVVAIAQAAFKAATTAAKPTTVEALLHSRWPPPSAPAVPPVTVHVVWGYAGWRPGQIGSEMDRGDWAVVPVPDFCEILRVDAAAALGPDAPAQPTSSPATLDWSSPSLAWERLERLTTHPRTPWLGSEHAGRLAAAAAAATRPGPMRLGRGLLSVSRPAHPHSLSRIVGKPPGYRGVPLCDICRKSDIPVTYNCATCKYDECEACHAKTEGAFVFARSGHPAGPEDASAAAPGHAPGHALTPRRAAAVTPPVGGSASGAAAP